MTTSINYMKLIMSIGMIVFVGALVVGGTGAFFSDTETSTGNTFTAGAIDLKVDSQAHYAGLYCNGNVWELENTQVPTTRPDLLGDECDGTWTETDLGPTYQFFSLDDLKPGDEGENTISLHVINNDAYMCAIIDNMHDNDLGLTEPEGEAGDVTNGTDQGELAPELHFFAWAEEDGDNVWEAGEPELFSNTEGPASDVLDGVVYPMFTPATTAFTGDAIKYVGLYWCYGDITVGTNTLSCDGSSVTNMSQTDQLTADISFYVEQARNNEGFECPALPLPEAELIQGSGWSPVEPTKEWFAKARNNNGGFEVAIGTNDSNPATQDTADTTWVAGQSNPFTLEYDGAGIATLTAGGQSVTFAVGSGLFSRIGINAKAPNTVTTEVTSLSLTGVAPLVIDSVSATGSGGNDVKSLTIVAPTLNSAWTLSGEFTFSDVGASYSQEYPAVQFSID